MEQNSCKSQTFSLPTYQIEWLEQKKREQPQKPISKWMQESLDRTMQQERTQPHRQTAFVMLFLLIGGTLAVFTFLLTPTLSVMFSLFLIISFICLTAGYIGLYLHYKERPRKWIS